MNTTNTPNAAICGLQDTHNVLDAGEGHKEQLLNMASVSAVRIFDISNRIE